jgi:hypothetical protein
MVVYGDGTESSVQGWGQRPKAAITERWLLGSVLIDSISLFILSHPFYILLHYLSWVWIGVVFHLARFRWVRYPLSKIAG